MFVSNKCYSIGELIIECEPLVHILFEEQKSKRCDHCLVVNESLKMCSQCKKMFYCDKKCQKSDWKCHKNECKYYQTHYHLLNKSSIDKILLRLVLLVKHNQNVVTTIHVLPNGSKRSLNSLVSHYNEIIKDSERKLEIECIIKTFKIMSVGMTDEELIKLYGTLIINSFGIHMRNNKCVYEHCGSGLYIIASALDHSCTPNVTAIANENRMQIKALKDIKAGDELFVNYIDTQLPKRERILELKSRYYFECNCYRCEFENNVESGDQKNGKIFNNNNYEKSYDEFGISQKYKELYRYDPNVTFSLLEKLKFMLENGNDNNNNESKSDLNEYIAYVRNHIIVSHGQHHCMFQLFSTLIENSAYKQIQLNVKN